MHCPLAGFAECVELRAGLGLALGLELGLEVELDQEQIGSPARSLADR